ncbi:hypothetical protein RRG08_037139 [Elysia crispata]|uniref:SMB domain-containing protein n=1 Tax=Elysia crispata TaxID=231223 RepID=A0AAE1A776_9GAST|nr:hypothetical protein RRG08_037139 [Elysia crispata]
MISHNTSRRGHRKSPFKFQILQPSTLKIILLSVLILVCPTSHYRISAPLVLQLLALRGSPMAIAVALSEGNVSTGTLKHSHIHAPRHAKQNSTGDYPSLDRLLDSKDAMQGKPISSTSSTSCDQRCGEDASYPCSCDEKCVVHKTCCNDLSEACPELYGLAVTKFADLLLASVRCDMISAVFMVESCPTATSEKIGELETGDKSLQTTFSTTLSDERSSLEMSEEINSLSEILSNAPVTDNATGIIYANASIYNCNRVKKSVVPGQTISSAANIWHTQIGTLKKKSPVGLKNMPQELDLTTFTYVPLDAEPTSGASLCYGDEARSCIGRLSTDLGIPDLTCNTTVSDYYRLRITLSSIPQAALRAAQYICPLCLSEYQRSSGKGQRFFLSGFKVLMRMSETPGHIEFELHESLRSLKQPVPWWSWVCEQPEQARPQENLQCQVLECDQRFVITPEKTCGKLVEIEISIQEEVMFQGRKCKIDPAAFAEIVFCYFHAFHELKASSTLFRSKSIHHLPSNIKLTALRMIMYFEAGKFEKNVVDLYFMHRTFSPIVSVFVKTHCQRQNLTEDRQSKSEREIPSSQSQHTSKSELINTDEQENTDSRIVNTKEKSNQILLTNCFQLSWIDTSLDDCIRCDSKKAWYLDFENTNADDFDSKTTDLHCLKKGDDKYEPNESPECSPSSLPYLITILTWTGCIQLLICLYL